MEDLETKNIATAAWSAAVLLESTKLARSAAATIREAIHPKHAEGHILWTRKSVDKEKGHGIEPESKCKPRQRVEELLDR